MSKFLSFKHWKHRKQTKGERKEKLCYLFTTLSLLTMENANGPNSIKLKGNSDEEVFQVNEEVEVISKF